MILFNMCVLAAVALVAWWLTGYDSNLQFDGRRSDFWRRFLRIIFTLFLVEAMIFLPPLAIFFAVLLGVIWASCVAELVSRSLRRLFDPSFHDDRPFDPGKSQRYMNTIKHLIKTGRKDEAIKLCEEFKQSGEVDLATLETTLELLGVKQKRQKIPRPLAEAAHLRKLGKFAETEQLLKALLAKNPENLEAAMMLMRVYAEDLHQPGKAMEVLRQYEAQPHASPSHIEFARRSIAEWSQSPVPVKADETAVPPHAQSVDELLAGGHFGTAIEILEEQARSLPDDFDLRLKLAEVHGRHFGNFKRAGKIVREIEMRNNFNPEQARLARNKLREWQNVSPPRV